MKAIQLQPKNTKDKTHQVIYSVQHYILYIVYFITYLLNSFFSSSLSLLRRLVSKSRTWFRNRVLGLYSLKTFWRRSGTFSSVVLPILCGLIIVPVYNNIDKTNAATNEQTTPTLTLNITNDTASLDLVVMDIDGTFASSSTSGSNATFTVTTNNFTGYTLSIKSSSSDTNLTNNEVTPNAVLETVSSSANSETFNSPTYNGKWGYLPSKYNSSTNTTTYYPSPTTIGATLDKTSAANSTANSYTIAIGARADYSKPTGTYSNTYILTTVINGFDYSISYNKGNTTDTVSNLPNVQTASATSDSSIALSSTEPTRSGYSFEGWCSVLPTTVSGTDSCSGDAYTTGATYYFNKVEDNTDTTLYAMWEKSVLYIQDLTLDACKVNIGANGNAANIGDNITVYDRRDNNDYTVRYINGYCWMTQNLRFANIDLKITTSNVDADKTLTYYDLSNSANCGNNSNGYKNPCIKDSGDAQKGAWYNFAAASAGYVAGNSNSGNSSWDICPRNWHLPTGPFNKSGTDGYSIFQNNSFATHISANMSLSAFGAVASGCYRNGTSHCASNVGYWWSSTAHDNTKRYTLILEPPDNGFASSSTDRDHGFSIRCVRTS